MKFGFYLAGKLPDCQGVDAMGLKLGLKIIKQFEINKCYKTCFWGGGNQKIKGKREKAESRLQVAGLWLFWVCGLFAISGY